MSQTEKKIKKKIRKNKINSTELIIDNQNATSFGGLTIARTMSIKIGIWQQLINDIPEKSRGHKRHSIIIGSLLGFLSGSSGVQLLEDVKQDLGLLNHFEIEGLPSIKNFWEELAKLGDDKILAILNRILRSTALKILKKTPVEQLQLEHGFIPLFGDGSLLECSKEREGAKYIPDKGYGLMWSNWYIGPVLVGQHLCGAGEGEHSTLRNMIDDIMKDVVNPLGRKRDMLVLMDSLHGDNTVMSNLEQNNLYYIIGGNKLKTVEYRLKEIPDGIWQSVPEKQMEKGLREERVCITKIQCYEWEKPRYLICKECTREGEVLPYKVGIFSNIPPKRLGLKSRHDISYILKIFKLYSKKMGMEGYFKDSLIDLNGHHPPSKNIKHI